MILRSVFGATVVVLAFGSIAVDSAYAQRRDGALLPQETDGDVTAVGCLVKGTAVRGGKDDYVLARPKRGPIASVPEASCTADAGADALQLDNAEKGPITTAMIGKWVQITGRLEKETSKDPDNLRELDVASVKLVPVVIPRPATAAASPSPAPAAAPAPRPYTPAPAPAASPAEPAPAPAALPKTASPIPAFGLAGLLLLSAGLALRTFRLRRQD
jgi:hypothetical protein